MEQKNMKRINLTEVQSLPNGTKVFVECVGNCWTERFKTKGTWNIKQDDGLHYETENADQTISFPYDYDYDSTDMSIVCYVEEYGCDCCLGDKPLHWVNWENSAFIDSKGEVAVTLGDGLTQFKVKYCPNCGKKF